MVFVPEEKKRKKKIPRGKKSGLTSMGLRLQTLDPACLVYCISITALNMILASMGRAIIG